MADAAKVAELLALLKAGKRFLVTSHARPDGDAIGSALGLMHLLEAMGKRVDIVFHDPVPLIYRSLPGAERIVRALPSTPPDAAILLECDCVERSGYVGSDFQRMAPRRLINIDHHQSGKDFADFNWIDPAECAVGAMVYTVAVASGVAISPAMAKCLYVAVLTDTGSFTYPSTTAATFALAEHLVASGADPNGAAQAVYFSNPASKFRLLGEALRTMHVDGALAWAWVKQEDIHRANAEIEDCEGVVNYLIGIAGVRAAVFLREHTGGGQYRLSLRSKGGPDVARVAESFGGGGHRSASGCTLDGPLEDALARVLAGLRAELERSPDSPRLVA